MEKLVQESQLILVGVCVGLHVCSRDFSFLLYSLNIDLSNPGIIFQASLTLNGPNWMPTGETFSVV